MLLLSISKLELFHAFSFLIAASHRLSEVDKRNTLIFQTEVQDAIASLHRLSENEQLDAFGDQTALLDGDCSCCPGWQHRAQITCTRTGGENDKYCLTSNGYVCPEGYYRIRTKTECQNAGKAFDVKNDFKPMLVSRDPYDPRGCWLWEESGRRSHYYWNPHKGLFNSCAPRILRNSICTRDAPAQATALLQASVLTNSSAYLKFQAELPAGACCSGATCAQCPPIAGETVSYEYASTSECPGNSKCKKTAYDGGECCTEEYSCKLCPGGDLTETVGKWICHGGKKCKKGAGDAPGADGSAADKDDPAADEDQCSDDFNQLKGFGTLNGPAVRHGKPADVEVMVKDAEGKYIVGLMDGDTDKQYLKMARVEASGAYITDSSKYTEKTWKPQIPIDADALQARYSVGVVNGDAYKFVIKDGFSTTCKQDSRGCPDYVETLGKKIGKFAGPGVQGGNVDVEVMAKGSDGNYIACLNGGPYLKMVKVSSVDGKYIAASSRYIFNGQPTTRDDLVAKYKVGTVNNKAQYVFQKGAAFEACFQDNEDGCFDTSAKFGRLTGGWVNFAKGRNVELVAKDSDGKYIVGLVGGVVGKVYLKMAKITREGKYISGTSRYVEKTWAPTHPTNAHAVQARYSAAMIGFADNYGFEKGDAFNTLCQKVEGEVKSACPDYADVTNTNFGMLTGGAVNHGQGKEVEVMAKDSDEKYIAGLMEEQYFKMSKFDVSGNYVGGSSRYVWNGQPTLESELTNYYNQGTANHDSYKFKKGSGFEVCVQAPGDDDPTADQDECSDDFNQLKNFGTLNGAAVRHGQPADVEVLVLDAEGKYIVGLMDGDTDKQYLKMARLEANGDYITDSSKYVEKTWTPQIPNDVDALKARYSVGVVNGDAYKFVAGAGFGTTCKQDSRGCPDYDVTSGRNIGKFEGPGVQGGSVDVNVMAKGSDGNYIAVLNAGLYLKMVRVSSLDGKYIASSSRYVFNGQPTTRDDLVAKYKVGTVNNKAEYVFKRGSAFEACFQDDEDGCFDTSANFGRLTGSWVNFGKGRNVELVAKDLDGNYIVGLVGGKGQIFLKMAKISRDGTYIKGTSRYLLKDQTWATLPTNALAVRARYSLAMRGEYGFVKGTAFTTLCQQVQGEAKSTCPDYAGVENTNFGKLTGAAVNHGQGKDVAVMAIDSDEKYIAGLMEEPYFKMAKFDFSGNYVAGSSRYVWNGQPTLESELKNYYNQGTPNQDSYKFKKGSGFEVCVQDHAFEPEPASTTLVPAGPASPGAGECCDVDTTCSSCPNGHEPATKEAPDSCSTENKCKVLDDEILDDTNEEQGNVDCPCGS
eukprot:TRINITY_DN1142_c0_g2_i1.p1 TRINITY_DN1142_c0_g2~~TRINITY_DN1142_c0_g2_i1.p1  ORF type:complete len:1316 (+),score=157.23 TRINITY_DN1142_c0_g2_i1:43-3990(+)